LQQRRLAVFIIVAGVVLAAVVFVAVFLITRSQSSAPPSEAAPAVRDGRNLIITGRDEAGRLSQLLVAIPREQGGWSIYTLPSRTYADTPGYGFQQLDKVAELGGQELLDQTVANLLQVPIRFHIAFDYGALEAAAEQAGTINFKSDSALNSTDGLINLAAGDNPLSSQRAISYLKAAVNDGKVGAQVQALFYRSLHDSLMSKPESDRRSFARQLCQRLQTDLDADDFVDIFADMTVPDQPFAVQPLPVRVVGSGQSWYFEPVPDEIAEFFSSSAADSSISLEIHNGTSDTAVVEAVVNHLAPLHFDTTVKAEASGVSFDVTQIRCGSEALEEGGRVRELLGKGTIIKDEYLEKQQIVVIIGKDLSLQEFQGR